MSKASAFAKPLLNIPAALYWIVQKGHETAFRIGALKAQTAPVPVISVGNIMLGGSGKTPFTIYLADLLRKKGRRPAIVSRGYKGSYEANYLVVGDGASAGPSVGPDESGDEPYLMATRLPHVPVLVGRKRIHPATAAHELFNCDVVVLDDGFQHLRLSRDVDIVLLSGAEHAMFPKGNLREPLSALKRADIIVTAVKDGGVSSKIERLITGLPRYTCGHEPTELIGMENRSRPEDLVDCDVTLISGIAGPKRFRKTAERIGWRVKSHVIFPDHHVFTEPELEEALAQADDTPVIFTEKDWVKLPERFRELRQTGALRISVTTPHEAELMQSLECLVWSRA